MNLLCPKWLFDPVGITTGKETETGAPGGRKGLKKEDEEAETTALCMKKTSGKPGQAGRWE